MCFAFCYDIIIETIGSRSGGVVTKTLFISDLDGTLLDSRGVLTEKTASVLSELIKGGMDFTVATARTYSSVVPMFDGIPLTLPLVLMNGVVLFDPVERRTLRTLKLDDGTAKTVVEVFRRHGKYPLVYFDLGDRINIEFKYLKTPSQKNYVFDRQKLYHKSFSRVSSYSLYGGKDVIYFVCLDDPAELLPIKDEILSLCDVNANLYPDTYCGDYYLEIYNKNASKAEGAREVARLAGAGRTVAFGDNVNDLPMFFSADEAYATSNAEEEAKRAADRVIGSNDDDAVAAFLYERFHEEND